MTRFFNTAGPCNPADHYMLPAERRLPEVRRLIEQKQYFVVHAARQSGKTTTFQSLAESLAAEGKYAVLLTTCEAAQAVHGDLDRGMAALLGTLAQDAAIALPEELRPPEANSELEAEIRLRDLLIRWAQRCKKPIVLFLDEIDSLRDDLLLSVLRQLRSGYAKRPRHFPQSVALIGLRDVRDYKTRLRPEEATLGTSSPFNIKVESLTLKNFTAEEVRDLYAQHSHDTGQLFEDGAARHAWQLSGGQPWLVNAIARQAVEILEPDVSRPIRIATIEAAKDRLIARRDTHLDSLVERLKEPRVQRILGPLISGELLGADVRDDDLRFVQDLGLVVLTPTGVEIANPIYREVLPRALGQLLEVSLALESKSFVSSDGRLDFAGLLEGFLDFWRENEEMLLTQAAYSEAAAQLVFMAFLHKVVNGGGTLDREYATGRGRIDILIRWPYPQGIDRHALELKVWRDGRQDPLAAGLDQLSAYLDRLGLERGTLLIFDQRHGSIGRPEKVRREQREHQGRVLGIVYC